MVHISVNSRPELVPEIAADAPALDIRHKQKDEDRECRRTREQAERQQRPATNCVSEMAGAQNLPGPIAVMIELRRELGKIVRASRRCWRTSRTCCARHAAPG